MADTEFGLGPLEKPPIERLRIRWGDAIKTGLRKKIFEDGRFLELAQDCTNGEFWYWSR